jgi:hypothetical protein
MEAYDVSLVEKDLKQPTASVKPVIELKAKTEKPKKAIEPQTIRSVDIMQGPSEGNTYRAPHNRGATQDNKDESIASWFSCFKACRLSHLFHISNGFITDRVKGVTFEGRQNVVAQLSVGEKLLLRREPQNPHDKNAIRVERVDGQQVGYIDRELAFHLAYPFDKYGKPVPATVVELTGGRDSGTYRGVRIRFPIPGLVIEEKDEP